MAKKSFKNNNPALQFISAVTEEATAESTVPESPPAPAKATRKTESSAKAAPPGKAAPPKRHAAEPERKTRRVNLLLQPSVMDDISKIAHMQKTSANDLINSILRKHATKNADVVARYDEIFGD